MLLEVLSDKENKAPRQMAGGICASLISSAKNAKKRFDKSATEILRYCYADNHNFEYQSLPDDSWFRAKVAKTAEALQVFGPSLYAKNPNRQVNPRTFSGDKAIPRSDVMQTYLNYTPEECDLHTHSKYCTDESIACGAGVLWTGYDEGKKLITSKFDSVGNLFLDPDAILEEEMRYVIRERVRPKWEVMKEYPQWKDAINQLKPCKQRKSSEKAGYYQQTDQTSECVRYYEIYMKVGLHHYKKGKDLEKLVAGSNPELAAQGAVDDTPLKYLVGDGGAFIGVTNWEVPFYMDNTFPCTILSYFHETNSIWPVSVLKNGLGFQRAMNYIVTLLMGKFRFTSRSTLAIMSQNGNQIDDNEMFKVLQGRDVEAIKIQANGDTMRIGDYLQQFEWSQDYINHGLRLLSEMEVQFEKSTGLYSILYTGEGDRQARSASDARIKDQRANSRIDSMRDAVDKFHSKVARKEAMAARFLHTKDDIRVIFGDEYAKKWGILIKPDTDVAQEMFTQAVQAGIPQEEAMQMAQDLLQNATTLEDWLYESDYNIESGSTVRKDINQHIDTLKELMNQTVPTQLQSPDPMERAMGYHTQYTYFKAIGAPEENLLKIKEYAEQLERQARMPLPPQEGDQNA